MGTTANRQINGVAGHLARRGRVIPGSEIFGKALENFVFHELRAWSAYRATPAALSYWRLASGIEVDFIVDDMADAIDVKAARKATSDQLKGLRHLQHDHPEVKRRILVCLEEHPWRSEDGIDVLPVREFLRRLWREELL